MSRLLSALIAMLMVAAITRAGAVTLVEDGAALGAIHVPADPTQQEQFAGEELQRYIEQATGARLEVAVGAPNADAPAIVVAQVDRLALVGEQATEAEQALSIEGVANRTAGNHVIVAGGGPRGVVYAAYDLLEHLGFRWYWPGETGQVTPSLADLTFEDLAVARDPSFIRRHSMGAASDGWADVAWGADVVDWLVKARQNFWLHNPPGEEYDGFLERRGGTYTKIGSGHNWQHIIPASEYFADHPEWFPMVDGERRPEGQLCLSNPEVLQRLTDYALAGAARMAADPDVMFIDMTQNDGAGWCECPACRAIDDRDPSTHADIVLWAINQIAERVKQQYPQAVLFTFAYAGSAGLPSWITPADNVMIEQTNYCFNYGASFLNPNSGRGALYREQIDAWAPVTALHGIYEYFGFYNWLEALPVTLYRLAEEVPYYKQLGVHGFYSETEQRWSTNHLLYYAFARMWWDHETDVPAMFDEFVRLFYGPAQEPMRRFYLALETSGGPDRYWSGDVNDLPGIFPAPLRAQCRADLDEAKRLAAADPLVTARLAFVELGWRYTELHLEAMEAHAAFNRTPSAETRRAAAEAWRRYVDYFDELEGTHAFAESDLPRFRRRAESQAAVYAFDLAELPPGEFEYTDSLMSGGNAFLHGVVDAMYAGKWGLCLRPGQSGALTYEIGATEGHTLASLRFWFHGGLVEGVSNAIEWSLDGETWEALVTDAAPTRDVEHDLSAQVAGRPRVWLRARYASTLDRDWCALYRVHISGEVR